LQQVELSMVCVGLSERDLKNFGGATGGAGKIWGGRQNFGGAVAPSGIPLAPPLEVVHIQFFPQTTSFLIICNIKRNINSNISHRLRLQCNLLFMPV